MRDRQVGRASLRERRAAPIVLPWAGSSSLDLKKCFRTAKTFVELEPVRHRLERRVRAYLSVCMLALRLRSALHQHLIEGGVKEDEVAEYQERLLEDLGRVERVEVRLGNEAKTWYLNVTDRIGDGLRRLHMRELLKEEVKLAAIP